MTTLGVILRPHWGYSMTTLGHDNHTGSTQWLSLVYTIMPWLCSIPRYSIWYSLCGMHRHTTWSCGILFDHVVCFSKPQKFLSQKWIKPWHKKKTKSVWCIGLYIGSPAAPHSTFELVWHSVGHPTHGVCHHTIIFFFFLRSCWGYSMLNDYPVAKLGNTLELPNDYSRINEGYPMTTLGLN